MLIELYRIKIRGKRGYFRVIHWGLNLACTNSWLLYRKLCQQNDQSKYLTLIKFISSISYSLLLANKTPAKKRIGRPSIDKKNKKTKARTSSLVPSEDIRYDQIGHLPVFGNRNCCSHCKDRQTGFSTIYCIKCKVFLCMIAKRNCFYSFHNK